MFCNMYYSMKLLLCVCVCLRSCVCARSLLVCITLSFYPICKKKKKRRINALNIYYISIYVYKKML